MRKFYIDNLRSSIILMLFIYHTFFIFNNFSELYYVNGEPNAFMSYFIIFCFPFFMPVLFLLAGVSTKYSLQKREVVVYLKERFSKILLPFVSGIFLVLPVQSYYANKFRNHFEGSYFESLKIFFTDFADISGVWGGFTVGQLWFLLYLFFIAVASLPLISFLKNKKINFQKFNMWQIILILVLPLGLSMSFLNLFPEKSILYYFLLFMLGYLIFSEDTIQEETEKNTFVSTLLYVLVMGIYFYILYELKVQNYLFINIMKSFLGLVGICALMGLFKKYLDFSNKLTKFFASMSFPIYIFHQSILVAVAYYALQTHLSNYLQALIVICLSLPLTLLACIIVKKIPFIKTIFGIK